MSGLDKVSTSGCKYIWSFFIIIFRCLMHKYRNNKLKPNKNFHFSLRQPKRFYFTGCISYEYRKFSCFCSSQKQLNLLFLLLFDDARVKSLKPRCACTGVVLRLSDPPNMVQNIQWMFVLHRPKRSVDIKVERQLHDMRILGRIVGVRSTEQSVRHLSTPVSYHTLSAFPEKSEKPTISADF